MKEPMTDARRKQLYRIKKRKRRKQCIRVALRMAVLCFLVLFAVQKTADLLRVDDSDRMEDAEQSYSGQGGKTRTNTEKTWGVFGKADVLTQEDKLHSIEESDEYPDQLKELAEKNSETIDFVYDYPEMKDKKQTIDLSQEAKTDTVPLLLQWDERWGYMPYSGGLLGYTGCGPTNLAMVVLYLTGDKTVTPASVAEYAESAGYSVPGSGSSWTLDEGCLIIINVGPGDFTDSGHFITIIGYDRDGFIINDSNSRTNSKKRWSYEQLSRQMRNLWAMYN